MKGIQIGCLLWYSRGTLRNGKEGEIMKRIFGMYQGLRKEVYILCFGRFVTALGSLIWPMLTLILKNKLGFNAEQVAIWFLVFGILQVPFGLLGGKFTDKYNKRNLIIVFDIVSVILYVITAILPLTTGSLCLYYVGSLFQRMEWAVYDALLAELTKDEEREKAYSLQYLGNNLGVVFAPTIGGLLFNSYLWLSFLIAGLAILSSTILIYKYIPKYVISTVNDNTYENDESGSLMDVLKMRKILVVFVLILCLNDIIYAQFGYLLPIQMDEMFFAKGAVFFGLLTSINGAVVICFTPILTQLTIKWQDYERTLMGTCLEVVGLCTCFFYHDSLWFYVVSMIVFTLGEILHTLGHTPYVSKRIPASHRGRFMSVQHILRSLSSSVGNTIVGKVVVLYTFREGWIVVFIIGMALILLMLLYKKEDKKQFAMLYEK